MTSVEVLSTYIKKLSHPLKEIRERALCLLAAKLRLGWEFEDELSCTRELLEALLAWFHVQQPDLQREALQLLLATVKSKPGTYIVKEFGIKKIITTLNHIRHKIESDALPVFEVILETLQFIDTMDSDINVAIPPLTLTSAASTDSDDCSNGGFYNIGPNFQTSSQETSVASGDAETFSNNNIQTDGIRILLFPWVELGSSESKTIFLIEDALRLVKSIRRCCRFIRDVFLRDFPAEIFLNRPTIVKSLMAIAEGENGSKPWEALYVLFCITQSLRKRLMQLSSLQLVHDTKLLNASQAISRSSSQDNSLHLGLEDIGIAMPTQVKEDSLAALKQLPAPIFALDSLNSILSTMTRSIVLVDSIERTEILDMKEVNACLNLVEALVELLLDCVYEQFWSVEHSNKTQRDIAHKSCMVMRLIGDLMTKYRSSHQEDADRCHHRAAWIRLASIAEVLLNWSRRSALPPSALVHSLQVAQLDPAVDLLYPDLGKKIAAVLQNVKTSVDQDHKTKYKLLKKLSLSMESAVQFMKNKNSCRNSKNVLICIKNSLPCLEVHLNDGFLDEVANIVLEKSKAMSFDDSDWSIARNIALHLMSHNVDWIKVKFYKRLEDMVRNILVGEDTSTAENEKCLILLCDVSILTEICCHGLSSKIQEVKSSASQIMQYLLRGRLVLSESSWWRMLASLLPVLPLLQAYVAHDTQLGQAICKSLEFEIAECMGISLCEVAWGLTRLMFVKCLPVQFDAAHSICKLIDDEKYLPPKELLRSDVLINALKRVKPEGFNVDESSSPIKSAQTTGLIQILEVLKQDLTLDEDSLDFVPRISNTTILEPSLRRSTLQQLSVMMRQQDLHATFVQSDGVKLITALLRMSLKVDDYLAFPECAISCVSVLNSVCFACRHDLLKLPDLPLLLFRVILAFPANDSSVLLCSQVLSLVAWSGFALQELDQKHRRVPALPQCVVERTNLPFVANSYWSASPNAEHSSIEWLMSDEEWRSAVRVRWWCVYEGPSRLLRTTDILSSHSVNLPLSMRLTSRDIFALRTACPIISCTKALLALENATTHNQVIDALNVLESYINICRLSATKAQDLASLPWHNTRRFLCAPPASMSDTNLLIALMRFIQVFMDSVDDGDGNTVSWIKPYFIGSDVSVISLLSRTQFYPQQSPNEEIEVTQLHIQIVKVLLRCVKKLEYDDDYDSSRMESLVKILIACLEKIDLQNFHKLGYLNDLMRCVRHCLHSRYSKLSEDTLASCLEVVSRLLSGCASAGGRKGQSCRLDAAVALLALMKQIDEEGIPVQRWSESWDVERVSSLVACTQAAAPELRAAALQVIAALAHRAQMVPHLLQAISNDSLSDFALSIFCNCREANVVRAAAAELLTSITSRASPHTDVLECDLLARMNQHNFIDNCMEIMVDFCNEKSYQNVFEPNVPVSLLERKSELEVRAQKSANIHVSPSLISCRDRPPPTAALVSSLCDVLHNASVFQNCPVQAWNERGLYRLLFRCASWTGLSPSENLPVRASACRAIVAAFSHKCVRTTLASTKDCIHGLLTTLEPIDQDEFHPSSISACAQGLNLLASLLSERGSGAAIWRELVEGRRGRLFDLMLQCMESNEGELNEAALYCLTHLTQSAERIKLPDITKHDSCVHFLDSLQVPANGGRFDSGDAVDSSCQPDYVVEEYCKILMNKYQAIAAGLKGYQTNQDDSFTRVTSCLASILAVSSRSREYAVHRSLHAILLSTLQRIRDKLSLQGKPVEVIRSANSNPVLRTILHILSVVSCFMCNCTPAKDNFAEDNLQLTLNRLWPWCMMTDQLRVAAMQVLMIWTNDCPKAWSAMSTCVGGRTLIHEVCMLLNKEASLQSKPRPETLLLLCIYTVTHCAGNAHCAGIALKAEVLSSLHKLRPRAPGGAVLSAWAGLCAALSLSPAGALSLLHARQGLSSQVRAALLPALANAAHHHRNAFLQAPDLLELLSGSLLAGDHAEVVTAARAVWALAANNHRAKLVLRSAGVVNAVQSAVLRVQRPNDPLAQRALQILTYTNTVLQTT